MVRRTTKIKNNIPIRRNVMRWEGADAPPEMVRRGPVRQKSIQRFGSAPSRSGFFSFLGRLLLVPLSIGLLVAIKLGVDRFLFPPLIGIAPAIYSDFTSEMRSPDMKSAFAA